MTTLVRRAGPGAVLRSLATRVGLVAGLATAALVSLSATTAHADSMDPTPERFVIGNNGTTTPACIKVQQSAAALKAAGKNIPICQPNNVAFDNLVSELGVAIAPTAFHPARTTGFGGFAFTVEASYTKINADGVTPGTTAQGGGVQYWHLGTQGSVNPNTGNQSSQNTSPDSLIQVYSLKARKGLPLGFEITGDVGYIANTVMWTAGADVRWALLEGFRTGWPSYLPDVSAGGGVRSLTGTSKFSLTTVGIDAQISKPITLADTGVLTPYLGYQRLYIFGDSSTVDLTPNTDALKQCGNPPTTNPPTPATAPNGQPNCQYIPGTTTANNSDFNNDAVFAKVRNSRDRGIIGVNYRYEVLYLAGQFLFDLVPPNQEDANLNPSRQWTLSFEAGVYF